MPYVKLRVDEGAAPGSYWLTGSQQFQLMRGVTESLAGRVAILELLGYSQRELDGARPDLPPFLPPVRVEERPLAFTGPPEALYERIWRGSFPPVHGQAARDREAFLGSYLQTYVQRDVRDLLQVGDLTAFTRFVRACAARTAQLLNLSALARDVDVSVPTAKSWLSVLVASFQVHLLPPLHDNRTMRLVKSPKLYFLDTGLCCHLLGWTTPQTLAKGAMAGALFETWVVVEILKSWWHHGREAPLGFYRDRDGREVDLVADLDGTLHPIEIKASATPRRRWLDDFRALDALGRPVGPGTVVCLAPEVVPLSARVDAVPVGIL